MSDRSPPELTVRAARTDERLAVRRLLDSALLTVEALETRIAAGDVLVATDDRTVVGAVVLEPNESGAHVAAITVRRRRRDRGIGTALIRAAAERHGRLTAAFDADVAPFYASLGFQIEPADEPDRRRGVLK